MFILVSRLSDYTPIGTMTVYVSIPHGTADLGIMIGDRTVWGMGYGEDAWCTMVAWLSTRQEIRKLTAGTLACNLGMIKLMERFPIIVLLGAALIGWVGGETMVSDVALKELVEGNPWMHYTGAALGAIVVVAVGKYLQKRHVHSSDGTPSL